MVEGERGRGGESIEDGDLYTRLYGLQAKGSTRQLQGSRGELRVSASSLGAWRGHQVT